MLKTRRRPLFMCPFGTYAYRRMSFGLCNALATFQICMLSIFSDMVERVMEVFMDDITIYGSAFDECLVNLEAVLNWCIEKDLVLNWDKCHFMVQQGIVLGWLLLKKCYLIAFLSPKQSEIEESSLESMAKMSEQGVRTHHRRVAERGLWQAGGMTSKACSL